MEQLEESKKKTYKSEEDNQQTVSQKSRKKFQDLSNIAEKSS